MKFYHGSVIKGLTELQPHQSWYSNVSEPLVYLTTSRQLALHYIWDIERIGIKMPMLHICDDSKLIFQEMFSGALEYFYKGVSGYIYHCEGDYPINPITGVLTCATTNTPVPVTDCEYIDNVYEHIWQYAKDGMFEYERYEDLPQWRIDVIRGQVTRFIKRNNLLKEHRKIEYMNLLTTGKLNAHLVEVDQQAQDMYDQLMHQMAVRAGITEQLKTSNQTAWVQTMNTISNQVREVVNAELIYT